MQTGFVRRAKDNFVYYTIPEFDSTGIVQHCFTTKHGGVSTGDAAGMNLGFKCGDKREDVLKNYNVIGGALGIDPQMFVLSDQVHEDKIRIITSADCGKGIAKQSDIIGVDALVCAEPNVPFITFYADCVPLFFLDPVKKVAALAHSGWRSTVLRIGEKTIETMVSEFGSARQDILAGIGPGIGQCHFEVGSEVAAHFGDEFAIPKGNKYYINLWGVIAAQLKSAGIADKNITIAGMCTACRTDEFYSYRAERGKVGRMAAIMQLI